MPDLKDLYLKQREDLLYPLIQALENNSVTEVKLMVEVITSIDKLLNLDIVYAHIFCEKSSVEQEVDGMGGFDIL